MLSRRAFDHRLRASSGEGMGWAMLQLAGERK
jgi:hypothetical protein